MQNKNIIKFIHGNLNMFKSSATRVPLIRILSIKIDQREMTGKQVGHILTITS